MSRFVRIIDINGYKHHVNVDHIVDVKQGRNLDNVPHYLILLSTGDLIQISYTAYKRLSDLPDRLFIIGIENAVIT